jgi:hypothetical protein
MLRAAALLFFCLCTITVAAQGFFPKRTQSVAASDTIQLDTLSIVPGTFNATLASSQQAMTDSVDYTIDYAAAKMYLRQPHPNDSIQISYEVFPFLFTAERSHKNQGTMTSTPDNRVNPFLYNPTKQKSEDPFAMGGLNKSGSLSRGISFGNTRDVSVNSNLNLQISGRITDNVDLMMVATDDNLPIQADGTTQQLQEFDRVYIQITSPRTKLIAGDFFTTRPNSYFMNFNKRGQGLSVQTSVPLGPVANQPTLPNQTVQDTTRTPKTQLLVSASAAISKGKFARNTIQGVEGNQGPYRLRGAENELFIIVLSGTEKVYVDGKLMVRGQEYDYVIDYNTAEVTFTAKQLITKDKRIVVEFQYSDRNYSRSLLHGGLTWEQTKPVPGIDAGKKMPMKTTRFLLNVYSEQDHKNQPVQQSLTGDDIEILAAVGDTLNRAVIPGVDSVGFSDTEVRYEKIDTLVNSVLYTDVFVYSTVPDSAVWRCAFSYVGPNNGNYRQVNSAANGKVFEWTAPVSGIPQGDYEPVVLIVTPKKRQMVTFASQQVSATKEFYTELAMSTYDLNTFSPVDSRDDQGYAGSFGWKRRFKVTDSTEFTLNLKYEYMSKYFTFIERYRPVEFERDWNLGWNSNRTPTADQHMVVSAFRFGSTKNKFITGYDFSAFNEGAQYTGIRNGILLGVNHKRVRATLNASYLTSTGTYGKTDFSRERLNVTIPITKALSVGGWEEIEFSRIHKPSSDTLQAASFGYIEWESFVQLGDSSKTFVRGFYKQRSDWLPMQTRLDLATFGENIGASVGFNQLKNQRLNITASYRKVEIRNYLITQQQPDNTIVGRVEYSLRLLKGAIDLNTFYETGSGLEVKKEFFYLEVPAGQGAYAWTDYNGNGVKELNEFEVALFSDQALYIRVYTPTNQYVKVYTNQFSQSIRLKTPQSWQQKKGFLKLLTRFSDQAAYRVDRKTQSRLFEHAYLPQIDDAGDTTLVSLNATIRNTIFFNQLSSKFGLDYTWQTVQGKNLLTNGIESRGNEYHQIRMRWNLTRAWSLITEYKTGVKDNTSQFFSTRNYFIKYYETEPRLSYQPGTTFRISLIYRYAEKKNDADLGGETTNLQKFGVEFRATKASKGSLDMQFNYFRIAYDGTVNSTIGYEMLEGLKPGENFTWKAGWQQSLGGSLQLTLGYEGRKTPDNKPIHTGTAQVRAMF